jgi:hypothetical protein
MTPTRAFLFGVVLLALAPFAAPAQPVPPQPSAAVEPLLEPTLPADAEFARNIALIRADLFIADALVRERDWVDARPHANFPREEIYGAIRDKLRTYKTPPFDGALRELAHAVAVRSIKRYDRAFTKVQGALIDAEFSLRARQRDWPRFTLQVAAATLHDAADEYDAAVADGRILHAVGYQSARGIVFESTRMVDGAADALSARDAQAVQSLRGILIRLKDAFAPLSAPKEPRADVETVRALIAQGDALARRIK